MKTIKYVLLGLITLFIVPAFGSEVQITTNNNSDSDLLTISLYSGIGDVNLGCPTGIGTELMYNNVSVNLGFGKYEDYFGGSVGIKIYNSGASSKNKVFAGFNHIYDESYPYYIEYSTVTAGYRYTSSNGLYMSPYVGMRIDTKPPICFGLNAGYQFKSIHLNQN